MEQGLVFAFFLNSMRRSNEGRFDAPMADILVNRARLIHPEMPL
jgi:hypothetical protein